MIIIRIIARKQTNSGEIPLNYEHNTWGPDGAERQTAKLLDNLLVITSKRRLKIIIISYRYASVLKNKSIKKDKKEGAFLFDYAHH